MHIAGLDIGFSKRKRTNALAVLRNRDLTIEKLSVAERDAAVRRLVGIEVLAIDAPVIPRSLPTDYPRLCETVFSRGLFQTRCKPAFSHIRGTGQLLRLHGAIAVQAFSSTSLDSSPSVRFPAVMPGVQAVEAFPNTFLGVLLTEDDYATKPTLRRGRKFDWLYDTWRSKGLFGGMVALADLPGEVADACRSETDHEKRAALVCLLTSAFALAERYTAVGSAECGYFFLPPLSAWSSWAATQARETAARVGGEVIVSE